MKRLRFHKEKNNINNPSEKNSKRTSFGRWFNWAALVFGAAGVTMTGVKAEGHPRNVGVDMVGGVKAKGKPVFRPQIAYSESKYKSTWTKVQGIKRKIERYLKAVKRNFKAQRALKQSPVFPAGVSPAKELVRELMNLRKELKKVGLGDDIPAKLPRALTPQNVGELEIGFYRALGELTSNYAAKKAAAVTPTKVTPSTKVVPVIKVDVSKLKEARKSLLSLNRDRTLPGRMRKNARSLRSRMLRLVRKRKFTQKDQKNASKYYSDSTQLVQQAKQFKERMRDARKNTNSAVALLTPYTRRSTVLSNAQKKRARKLISNLKRALRKKRYASLDTHISEANALSSSLKEQAAKNQLALSNAERVASAYKKRPPRKVARHVNAIRRLLKKVKRRGVLSSSEFASLNRSVATASKGMPAGAAPLVSRVLAALPEDVKVYQTKIQAEIAAQSASVKQRFSKLIKASATLGRRPFEVEEGNIEILGQNYAPEGPRVVFLKTVLEAAKLMKQGKTAEANQKLTAMDQLLKKEQAYAKQIGQKTIALLTRSIAAVNSLPAFSTELDGVTYSKQKLLRYLADTKDLINTYMTLFKDKLVFDHLGAIYGAALKDTAILETVAAYSKGVTLSGDEIADVVRKLLDPDYKELAKKLPPRYQRAAQFNTWFRYFDILNDLFTMSSKAATSNLTPQQQKTVKEIARLKANMSILHYYWGGHDDSYRDQINNKTKREAAAKKIQEKAKDILLKLKTAGLAQSKYVSYFIGSNNKLLTQYKDVNKVLQLYNGALNLLMLSYSERLMKNNNFQLFAPTASPQLLKDANLNLKRAKKLFELNYSNPSLAKMRYSRVIFSALTQIQKMLMPQAFTVSETGAEIAKISTMWMATNPDPNMRVGKEEDVEKQEFKHLLLLGKLKGAAYSSRSLFYSQLLDPRIGRSDVLLGPALPVLSNYHAEPEINLKMGSTSSRIKEYYWETQGFLYQEVFRQKGLVEDPDVPNYLKLGDAAYLTTFQTLLKNYSAMTPAQRLKGANEVLIKILEAKIDRLNTRLKQFCAGKGKKICRAASVGAVRGRRLYLSPLGGRAKPQAKYVERAAYIYSILMGLRKDYKAKVSMNLMNGKNVPIHPVQAIMMAETALVEMDDKRLKDLDKNSFDTSKMGGRGRGGARALAGARLTGLGMDVKFDRNARVAVGTVRSLYFGNNKIPAKTRNDVSYNWFIFQYNEESEKWYLVNPKWFNWFGTGKRPQQYLGVIVGNKVHKLGAARYDASRKEIWPRVMRAGKPVLLPVTVDTKKGFPAVVMDEKLRKAMQGYTAPAVLTSSRELMVDVFGDELSMSVIASAPRGVTTGAGKALTGDFIFIPDRL